MGLAKKLGMMVSIVAVLGAAAAGCGTASDNQTQGNTATTGGTTAGGGKTIKIGYVTWAEDVAATMLWKQLLENKGYTVQTTQLDAGPLFAGLAQGGEDVFFDAWLPNTHKSYMQRYGSSLTNLGQWYQGPVKIGLVVPSYVKDVNSIADLNTHASEFNNQIVGIDAGAGEMQTVQNKVIPDYHLKLHLTSGSEASMLTALQRAISQKQPIVVTLWSPHWAFSKWHLKYLQDPKTAMGKSEHIQTEANKQWAASNPKVAGWLKNFKLTPNQLGELEQDINKDGNTKGVQEWISANQSLVNSWFK
ncbi:glycine betaine ABC transporter substrate-binding protein [Alicyclobacillus herbarius]|uniref:glycine betaine ABC transporter substrate-binding protein n=1 Tax=Alicyclobacillus herbarius TaxID=122960 RepID=UPI0004134A7F|nr:glycine betaine ABC transporter substrate-binding protein [Alicyclobacillus herbarius]